MFSCSLIKLINNKLKKFSPTKKFKLEELIDVYDKSIDLLIIDIIKSENLKYIYGILELHKFNNYINISIKLFFENENKNIIRKEVFDKICKDKIKDKNIDWDLIKYKIECPIL